MPLNAENNLQNEGNENIIFIKNKKDFVLEKGVGETVYDAMKRHLNIVAQLDPVTKKEQTYETLLSNSIRIAQNLKHSGTKPEDIIAICSFNNMDYCSVILGTIFTGAVNALLDPYTPTANKIHCLKLTTPKIVFCDEELENIVEQCLQEANVSAKIVVFGHSSKNEQYSDYIVRQRHEEDFKIFEVKDVDSTVIILFSSGTTGLPKGVCVTHYGLVHGAIYFKGDYMDMKTTMIVTSPFWISNVNSLIANLICGDTRIICKSFDESVVMKYVQDYKVSLITMSPANGAELIKHPEYYNKYDLSSLFVVGTGGSTTHPKQFHEYTKIFPTSLIIGGYGMTETGGHIFSLAIQKASDVENSVKSYVGGPIPGYKYKIVDLETEEPLGPNQEGELRVKFRGTMNSYYRNPEAYAESFDKDGYLKTGDILFYDENLRFYYVNRIKDNFKYTTFQISPVEIESVLIKHPNITQCVVFGAPDAEGITDLVTAAVVFDDRSKFVEKEVTQFVNDRLEDLYHIRGGVYLVDSIPTTSTGKIQRTKLVEMVLNLRTEKKMI